MVWHKPIRFLAGCWVIAALACFSPILRGAEPADRAGFDKVVVPFLHKHCVGCHGANKPKSDLSLHNVKLDDLAKGMTAQLWSGVLERLATGNMPPEEQPRPNRMDAGKVVGWIRSELIRSGHGNHLAFPDKGNHLSHELLFHQPSDAHPSTPARIWRISPHHYEARACTVLGRPPRPPVGFAGKIVMPRPFGLRGGPGIQDYASLYRIDEAQTEQLLLNAREIARRMMGGGGGGIEEKPSVHRSLQPFLQQTEPFTTAQVAAIVDAMSQVILRRAANEEETKRYTSYLAKQVELHGNRQGIESVIAAILLNPEILFRFELGAGPPDAYGRVMLAPREIAEAIAYAITDSPPDQRLMEALRTGQLKTRDDVRKQVRRLLTDDRKIENPLTVRVPILRFFREYFGYDTAHQVFKDKDLLTPEVRYMLVVDTDRLVADIFYEDRNVLAELLTTNKSYVASSVIRSPILREIKNKGGTHPFGPKNHVNEVYNLEPEKWSEQQPLVFPVTERAGILSQPSWLLAHSTNDSNHAIHRGKWLRERLLGGAIPDTPITVDAQLPDEPDKPLRQRMRVTREMYCAKCHQNMDPLGLSFEMFDDWGRFRTTELGQPVDTSGAIKNSPDERLEGPVVNAIDLVKKLAKSEHVHQVFVRHAFRYWMGRNETLEDAPTLQAAYKAYKDNGGSMKALITSLLTSDSFLYRTPFAAAR
jgi:hypothetical protein